VRQDDETALEIEARKNSLEKRKITINIPAVQDERISSAVEILSLGGPRSPATMDMAVTTQPRISGCRFGPAGWERMRRDWADKQLLNFSPHGPRGAYHSAGAAVQARGAEGDDMCRDSEAGSMK